MSVPEPAISTASFAAQHSTELYAVMGVLVSLIGALFLIIHHSINGSIAKLEVENGELWKVLRALEKEFAELKGVHEHEMQRKGP